MSSTYNNSIEKRLRYIEAALGIAVDSSTGNGRNYADIISNNANADVHGRVDNLCKSIDAHVTLSTVASNVQRSNELANQLSPSGLLLTSTLTSSNNINRDGTGSSNNVNVNVNASVYVYRRQEILARYDDLRYALEQLANIRDLLLISNPLLAKELQSKKGSVSGGDVDGNGNKNDMNIDTTISMDHVAAAPILASPSYTFASDPNNIQKLESLAHDVVEINDKSTALAQRVDAMVDRYYSMVSAVNERLILMQELQGHV